MRRKRRTIYWNPEKHPDFDAWAVRQENLSAAIRELFEESKTRSGLSTEALAAVAREVAPLVAVIVPPQGSAAPPAPPPEPAAYLLQEAEGLPPAAISAGCSEKTRANARKTAARFRKPNR